MSTESTETNTGYIPDDSDLNVSSGSSSWRPAKGKFVRGREIVKKAIVDGQEVEVETGTYPEEKKSITGLLRRIGIYQNPGGKYGPEHKIECDIETREGLQHLGVSLLDTANEFKVGIAALNLAWCLTQFEKDGPIRLETALGEPVDLKDRSGVPTGKKGGRPTYINAYRIEGNNATPIYRPKRDKNAPKQEMIDQWKELEPQVRAHAAYADRPVTEESQGGPTHLTELIKLCDERGWPSPSSNPGVWLSRIAEKTGEPAKARLTDLDDDTWGQVRQAIMGTSLCPEWLRPSQPKQGSLI